MGERRDRLEQLRQALIRYQGLLATAGHSLSGSERGRALQEMVTARGELARMIGRDKAAIVAAIGGMPHVVTGYRNFGDAFSIVLSEPDHPMLQTGLESVLRSVEQSIGYYQDEDEVLPSPTKGEVRLHPRLANVCDKLLRDGHLPQATFEASKALTALIQERSGLSLDGLPLVERALSPNGPMLTFNALSTETERDEHRGIFHLAQGVMLAVRHVGAHTSGRREPDARVRELLATINYLAHRIDKAKRR